MKLLNFVKNNILLLFTLFLLAFIPLYPKLPVIGVKHTWVYIRLEDFLVVVSLAAYGVQLLRRKATLKTPLTIPIFIYWGVGLVSTLFAIFFIFPHIINVFPTVAGLFYLRTIEYISVFFLAFSAVRKSINLPLVTGVLAATLLGVVGYGFGQKLYGFPAYLTMNEEFAKGIPLKLSDAARIPSTFAGHYDLAAYLILLIPLLGSMIFGFKNWFAKLFLFTTSALGLILLLMTASRVSFVVYLAAVTFLLILQKQKKFILPVIIASLLLLHSFQGLSQRFSNTISQVDLVVDARTGKAIGVANPVDNTGLSKSNTTGAQPKQTVVIKDVQSTGENLPHGSSYINLPSSSTNSIKNITQLLYQRSVVRAGTTSAEVTNIQGDFAVKKVLAYDVSFTTRFQGEWPRAIEAFQRNILLGSGPSSISLSTDNNYLRILGETGILGFASFVLIFLIISIYAYRVLPSVQSKAAKSLILGVLAGIFGLGLNAILIDVFVASKVAFVLWLLLGLTIGLLHAYQKNKINYLRDLRLVLFSTPAVASYFLVLTFGIFSVIFNNYFVGDDFTWLRWAAECDKLPAVGPALAKCVPVKTTLMNYFLHSDGFFYRPGMKLYFFGMYSLFWINAVAYHVVSIIAHFIVTILLFLVARRIFKSAIFGFIAALFFLVLSGHSETIFWIASIGHLLAAIATVLALVLFIEWKETKKFFFLPLAFLSTLSAPFFHEYGIVAPFLIILYDAAVSGKNSLKNITKRAYYLLFLLPIPLYLAIRFFAKAIWGNGDYSYRLSALPFNVLGNALGYVALTVLGHPVLSYYDNLRAYGKSHIAVAAVAAVVILAGFVILYRFVWEKLTAGDKKVLLFAAIFFFVPLLPFLGLGNIAVRYLYLGSFGVIIVVVWAMQKMYTQFARVSRVAAAILICAIVILFSWYHVSELQILNRDWQKAGDITSKLLVNLNDTFYRNFVPNPVFYFVNTPVKQGDAWIFPVGLKDALWFTFQNENLTVHQVDNLNLALDSAEGSASARVYQFDKTGDIEEIVRTKKTYTIDVNK